MKKVGRFLLALVLASAVPTVLAAQSVWVGGGGSVPLGDYGDYANTGFLAVAGVAIPVGDGGLDVFGEGFFGQNSHSDVDGDKTNPYGFMGGAQFTFGEADATQGLYVFGEVGILFHKYGSDDFEGSTDSGLGYGAGAGYFFPLGGLNGWIEARAMSASTGDGDSSGKTSFLGLLAGVNFPLGGGN